MSMVKGATLALLVIISVTSADVISVTDSQLKGKWILLTVESRNTWMYIHVFKTKYSFFFFFVFAVRLLPI